MLYKNASEEHRVWPRLHAPDGTTLELEPNEEVHLDLPDNFKDAYLRCVGHSPDETPCGGLHDDEEDELTAGGSVVVDGPPVKLGDGEHETLIPATPPPDEPDHDDADDTKEPQA